MNVFSVYILIYTHKKFSVKTKLKNFLFIIACVIFLLMYTTVGAMEIWVANAGSNTISVINNKTIQTIRCGKGPREVIFLNKSQLACVNECAQHSLAIYNIKTKKFLKRIKFSDEARGISFANDESKLYLVLKDKNELIEFDISQNKISRQIPTPRGPRNIALDIENNKIYITCNMDNVVAVYNISSFQKETEIQTAIQPYALKVRGEDLYVSSIGQNLLQVFSLKDYKKRWESACGEHPTSIDFNDKGDILITNFDSNQLSVLSSKTGKTITTIRTGRNPFNIKVFSSKNIVSNLGDNTLSLYDSHGDVTETYSVGTEPHGINVLNY